MWITSLKLKNFRSYKDLSLELANTTYFLIGKNGQGKTNVLESIALNSLAKSFRGGKTFDLIQHGEDFSRIELLCQDEGDSFKLEQYVGRDGHSLERAYWKNGIKVALDSFFGTLRVVVFSPEQMNLLVLGPSERRKYLNGMMLQTKPSLLRVLGAYLSVLQNRNALLSRIRKGVASENELDFWDSEIAKKGSEIVLARKQIIKSINASYQGHFRTIAGSEAKAKVVYKSGVESDADDVDVLFESFMAELLSRRQDDVERSITHVGPHRDNFEVRVDDRNILSFGSRGELRTAILALKFAETEMLSEGRKPIILLDDVFSELDDARRAKVMELASQHQTFITTCEVADLPKERKESTILQVRDSKLEPYEL